MNIAKTYFPDKNMVLSVLKKKIFIVWKNLLSRRKHYCFGDDYPNQDKI